jgi:AmmeMemoRadiSam system protein B
MTVRRPTWGNQFYPTDPAQARGMWEGFFERCEAPRIEDTIRAIQVPHAGWTYSGQAAAEAYNQLRNRDVKSVVLIGPQHHMMVQHIQIFPEGHWQSPLGDLEVDSELAARFLEFNDAFETDIPAHAAEHSLEVQIPPLVMVLPDVKIVPILTAAYQQSHPRILADALVEIVGTSEDLFVLISTDLYHGSSYEACKTTDSRTIGLVQAMDAQGLESALANGSAAACGGDGLAALLAAAQKLGIKKAHLLAAYNSNDITGQRGGYVVGYSAFAFTGD